MIRKIAITICNVFEKCISCDIFSDESIDKIINKITRNESVVKTTDKEDIGYPVTIEMKVSDIESVISHNNKKDIKELSKKTIENADNDTSFCDSVQSSIHGSDSEWDKIIDVDEVIETQIDDLEVDV
jgi:hypothetical protein